MDVREWRIRHQPEVTAVAWMVAGGLLCFGAALIIKWAVSSVLPITGGRIADTVLVQGVFAWAAAFALLAVARMDGGVS